MVASYTPADRNFDAILVGDYDGRTLLLCCQGARRDHAGYEGCSLHAVTIEGQAEMLGCLMLIPAPSSKVIVLDRDPNLLKVRIIAPNLESDGYEGWTTFRRLVPSSTLQNNRRVDRIVTTLN